MTKSDAVLLLTKALVGAIGIAGLRLDAERVDDFLSCKFFIFQIEELLTDIAVVGWRQTLDGVKLGFVLVREFWCVQRCKIRFIESFLARVVQEVEMNAKRETAEGRRVQLLDEIG